MLAAVTMKYDQMAAHAYGKNQETNLGDGNNQSFDLGPNSSQFRNEGFQNQPRNEGFPYGIGTRYAKIDFPKFYGEDPTGWVYKCERFFYYNSIENSNKVKLAILHLEDKALQWYQWFEKTHCEINWVTFKQGIVARFGPDLYEDASGN